MCKYVEIINWFTFFRLIGISIFVGYLMLKPFSKKNSNGTI